MGFKLLFVCVLFFVAISNYRIMGYHMQSVRSIPLTNVTVYFVYSNTANLTVDGDCKEFKCPSLFALQKCKKCLLNSTISNVWLQESRNTTPYINIFLTNITTMKNAEIMRNVYLLSDFNYQVKISGFYFENIQKYKLDAWAFAFGPQKNDMYVVFTLQWNFIN